MREFLRHDSAPARGLDDMSPREIVAELDKYVVGQREAKKAVAIALRNRIRRQKLDEEIAEQNAEERLLDLILPTLQPVPEDRTADDNGKELRRIHFLREKLRKQLRSGKLDNRIVEIEVREQAVSPFSFQIFEGSSLEELQFNMRDLLSGFMDRKPKKRRMRVDEAAEYIIQEEEQKL